MNGTIRLASEQDALAVAAIYAPYCDSNAVSFEFHAPSSDEMANRIRRTLTEWPWLVCEDAGVVAGYAYASRHRERAAYQWSVDTAVYVGDGFRGRGVGRGLYLALFELLRGQGYFKACAGITLPNPASVGLHEGVGFKLVGTYRGIGYKLGAWHDVAWYECTLQPERQNPDPPRPISEIQGALGATALKRSLR